MVNYLFKHPKLTVFHNSAAWSSGVLFITVSGFLGHKLALIMTTVGYLLFNKDTYSLEVWPKPTERYVLSVNHCGPKCTEIYSEWWCFCAKIQFDCSNCCKIVKQTHLRKCTQVINNKKEPWPNPRPGTGKGQVCVEMIVCVRRPFVPAGEHRKHIVL